MSTAIRIETIPSVPLSTPAYRFRLYGMCTIVALAFMLLGRWTDDSTPLVQMYMPLVGATMLVITLAGAECTLFLQDIATEHRQQLAQREQAEESAVERQRVFNGLWQALADSRGEAAVPEPILAELRNLFSANLVAVWSAESIADGFRLSGAHPLAADVAARLDTVGRTSPC